MKLSLLIQKLLCGVLFVSIVCMNSCTALKKASSASVHPVVGKEWKLPLLSNKELTMEWIPSGTFMMGSPIGETARKLDEGPETKIILINGYWLGKTELTIGDWKAFGSML